MQEQLAEKLARQLQLLHQCTLVQMVTHFNGADVMSLRIMSGLPADS